MNCAHGNFVSNIFVTNTQGGGPGFAEIRINCKDCGEPFVFAGVQRGLSAQIPTVNFDSTELRLPVLPKSSVREVTLAPTPPQGKPS